MRALLDPPHLICNMSIRSDIKGEIPIFKHDEAYQTERNLFRSMIRSLKTAEDNLAGRKKPVKRKKKSDTGTGETES